MASVGSRAASDALVLAVAAILLVAAQLWWRSVRRYNQWVRIHMPRTAPASRRWTEELSRLGGTALMLAFAVILAVVSLNDLSDLQRH